MRFAVVLLVLLAVVLLASPLAPAGLPRLGVAAETAFAQSPIPSGPIRVVSQDSKISFGKEVEASLTVESAASEITSVKTYFRPQGRRTITTYGYAEFDPDRKVTARLTIPTASPTYYPPGVVFEVTYEVIDAAGNRLETAPITVEYLDPGFNWKRRTRDGLTVIYHDRPDSSIDDLLEDITARIPRIEATVGAEGDGGSYRAILFNSNAEARKAFPFVSQAAAEGHIFAGFAYEQYGLFVLDHAGAQGVAHELTHLIFGEATNSPAAKRPAWLNEGMAVYFETGSRVSTGSRLRSAVRDGTLLPLRSMNSIPGRPGQIDVFYPQSGNFVGHLIERYGEDRMRALVAAFRQGALPAEAVMTAYGVSLDEIEAGWRRDIGARPLPGLPTVAPAPTAAQASSPRAPASTTVNGSPAVTSSPSADGVPSSPPEGPPAPPDPSRQATATPTVQDVADQPPSFTIWWFVAGLAVASAVFAAIYFVRRSRRGGP